MEKQAYLKNAYDMIYLTQCAVNGKKPDPARVSEMDFDGVFEACQKHTLTACTAYALDSIGVSHAAFLQEREKAVRKNILFDAERAKILKQMEAQGIWYMPLKGAILKDWYPRLGMRQMTDNDILYDGTYRKQVRGIMEGLGFTCEEYGVGKDDIYFKQPVYNFEMHHVLFEDIDDPKVMAYYERLQEHLIKDENNAYGYHLCPEDFYLYLVAHEHKHYTKGGVGVRSLADQYVFMQKFGDSYRWDYANAELDKMGIRDYEVMTRELAMKIFSGSTEIRELSEQERDLLDYHIFSGTHGNVQNRLERQLHEKAGGSRFRLAMRRTFPPMEEIKTLWPFFYRHKWLIPILWLWRPIDALRKDPKNVREQIHFIFFGPHE